MRSIHKSPCPVQMDMIDLKGKRLIQGPKPPTKEKSARNRFRSCIRCKAEMMKEDWNALFLDILEEVKKWVIITSRGEGADHYDYRLSPSLARGSDKRSSGGEGDKEERGSPIQRIVQGCDDREKPTSTLVGLEEARPRDSGSDRAPATAIQKVKAGESLEDLAADRPQECQHASPCDARNGSSPTRGLDHWGHREAQPATKGEDRHYGLLTKEHQGREKLPRVLITTSSHLPRGSRRTWAFS